MSNLELILNLLKICFIWLKKYVSAIETCFEKGQLNYVIQSKIAIHPNNVRFLDNKYWSASIEDWKKIIEIDWLKKVEYIKERFDCDDFSEALRTHVKEIYGLNCIGIAEGIIYDKDMNLIDKDESHRYCIIFDHNLSPYLVEPQSGQLVLYNKEKLPMINDRYYTINYIEL